MHIVRLSLICLIAFAFMVGCGMLGKQAEMSESTVEETAMESDMKGEDMAEAMAEAVIEEITLNVTGMT